MAVQWKAPFLQKTELEREEFGTPQQDLCVKAACNEAQCTVVGSKDLTAYIQGGCIKQRITVEAECTLETIK